MEPIDRVTEHIVSLPHGMETTAQMVAASCGLPLDRTRRLLAVLRQANVANLRVEHLAKASEPRKVRHWYSRPVNVAGCNTPDCHAAAFLEAQCRCLKQTRRYVCTDGHVTVWKANGCPHG